MADYDLAVRINLDIHYAYNKNGWRIQKTEEIQGNGPVQTAVTGYAYDANGNLTKITTPKGFMIRRGYDEDDRLTEERITDRKSGIDRRVQYAYDEAGNVLKRTVLGTDGEIQNCYLYDAFGAELETKEQFPNRIRYTGQQYDALTGQYYLRARYYDPVLGRFMQEDACQRDGLNLYAYCHYNPVVYYDSSGYTKTPQQSGAGCPPDGKIAQNDNDEDGVETETFLPDSYYEDNRLPKFVSPGTESLPKYDEFGNLKQIKYYDDYGREIGWVDFTDHGYPLEHSSPHWHEVQWNAQYPIGGYKIHHRFDTNASFNWQQDFERYGGNN